MKTSHFAFYFLLLTAGAFAQDPTATPSTPQNATAWYGYEGYLWRYEMGYMYQSSFNSADEISGRKRINHTLRFTVTSDAPFKRKEK